MASNRTVDFLDDSNEADGGQSGQTGNAEVDEDGAGEAIHNQAEDLGQGLVDILENLRLIAMT